MASEIFARLTPYNIPAKLAFNAVVITLKGLPQLQPALEQFLQVSDEQVYNADVARTFDNQDVIDLSDSPTDPDTETEGNWKEHRKIWLGSFVFNLTHRDPNRHSVWSAGKGRQPWSCSSDKNQVLGIPEIPIAPFGSQEYQVRGKHVRFQLDRNGIMSINRANNSRDTFIAVDGEMLDEPRSLNQQTSIIQLGKLFFKFEYTPYSQTRSFQEQRNDFVHISHGSNPKKLLLTPTPTDASRRIGKWTFGLELGKGGFGKVFSATDKDGNVATIKIIEKIAENMENVKQEIQTLRALTLEAKAASCTQILRLEEVIPEQSTFTPSGRPFEDIHLVFTPLVPQTLNNLPSGDTIDNLRVFQDALRALQFLHSRKWVHGDIKPTNIGILGYCVVLLDIGHAKRLPESQELEPRPGQSGTIGWLSPEQELHPYGTDADIWGLGISIFQLLFGNHPLKFSVNPWRKGNELLRPKFHKQEAVMCRALRSGEPDSAADLLLKMLSHSYSNCNASKRISAEGALLHPVFAVLAEEQHTRKFKRTIP